MFFLLFCFGFFFTESVHGVSYLTLQNTLDFIILYTCSCYCVHALSVCTNIQHAYVFVKMCSCVCVNAKAVLACQPTPFPLPVISSGVQALEREGKHRFSPHWGCQSSPLVSCRHSSSRQTPKRRDRGRHWTYNNNSDNNFKTWKTLALRNHSITYFNNIKEGMCVSFCTIEKDRDIGKTSETKRKKEGRIKVGASLHRGLELMLVTA